MKTLLIEIYFHLLLLSPLLFCILYKYKRNRLNFVITSIVTAVTAASITIASLSVAATAAILGAVGGLIVYGGMALSLMSAKKASGKYGSSAAASSATYGNPTLQTQTNPDLPVPLLYGTVKLAGNRIWQSAPSSSNIRRIVAFAEGEITDFTDIRLNDIPAGNVSGCRVEKFLGTNDQGLPSMAGLSTVGSLRNIAYLAITCNKTEKIDINYNLTAIVKGRKIRVYAAPNNYTVKYSENPAWVLFDFLTSYNGLGIALNNNCEVDDALIKELFDLNTFIESAAFCDETVITNGVSSPRFTFNMIFDSQTSARDLIDEIYRSCRGGLFTHNGKLQFKIDKAEPVSLVLTEDDIIKGSETFQLIPAEENYEILRLSYVSPDHEWQKVEAFAENPVYRYGAPVEHSVNCYSVTNFQQASRLAWYYINSKVLCPYFGSFQTDYRAFALEVGDVVQFDSLLMGLKNYKVKVTSVNNDGSGIYTVNWRNYDERLYSDELGSKEPRVLVSNLSDIAGYPEDVQNFNVTQSQNYFNFIWQYNLDPKDTYEIRMGSSWETGIVIGKGINSNNFAYEIPAAGEVYRFWIKAFNKYNYSKNPTLDIYAVDSIPAVNELVKFDLVEIHKGEFNNTHYYQGAIKLNTEVLWQTLAEKWENKNRYYETDGIWGAEVITEGSYISEVIDIGRNFKSIVSFSFDYECSDADQYITAEWRYSEDGENWTDWILNNIGEYQFRYCQFRAVFHAPNGVQMLLKSYKVNIDVPDKEIELEIEIPAEGGLQISYDFIMPPSIIGTVNDDIEAYIIVADKTNTGAFIKAYKNDGSLTGAKVNLRLKGY